MTTARPTATSDLEAPSPNGGAPGGPRPPRRRAGAQAHRSGGWKSYLKALGPGLVTGASDDDPSGIATYSQAGAGFHFGLLWTALLTLPLSATIQETCDRTALATGENLGELTRQRFQTWGRVVVGVLLVALLIANALNITADVLAVGAGMNLLHAGPITMWSAIAGASITVLLITGSFDTIAKVFKLLCIALLAYIAVLFSAGVDWRDVAAHTFVPHLEGSTEYLALLVAVLGTTISPYLFFWQSAHRVEERTDDDSADDAAETLDDVSSGEAARTERRSRFDVYFGVTYSNVVMFAIMVATGATIGAHGSNDVATAADAAAALRPLAGDAASMLFALGFIGAGMLAVPVLAGSASTGLAGLLGKEWGFSRRVRDAPVFYALVLAGTIGGTALSAIGVNPMSLLVIVAIINGIGATPFLIVVMLVSGDARVMGEHVNHRLSTVVGWTTVAVMAVSAVVLVVTTFAS